MSELPFVNRTDEFNFFKGDLRRRRDISTVQFICAPTGLGKSRFAQKIVRYVDTEQPDYIAIKLAVSASRSAFEKDGFYIRMLGKELDEYAKSSRRILTYKEFYQDSLSDYLRDTVARRFVVEVLKKRAVGKTLVEILDRILGTEELKEKDFFAADIPEVALSVAEYLTHVAKEHPLFLNIENIQNIDAISLDIFKKMLKGDQRHYLLLEYTTEVDLSWSLNDLLDEFRSTGSTVEHRKLSLLSVKDILNLFRNKPDALEAFIKDTYVNWDGNLRNLVDLNIRLDGEWNTFTASFDPPSDLNSISLHNIMNLAASERMVLSLLAVHDGASEIELLSRAFQSGLGMSFVPVDEILHKLSNKYVKFETEYTVQLEHDSLKNIIFESLEFSRELSLSINAWKTLYKAIEDKGGEAFVTKLEAAYYLIYLSFLEENPFEMLKCLDALAHYANHSLAPTRIVRQFDDIREKLRKAGDSTLLEVLELRMVEILSNLAMPSEALRLLDSLPQTLPEAILYRGVLLEDSGAAAKALDHVRMFEGHNLCRDSSRFKLSLELIKFASLRASNRYAECADVFHSMYGNADYARLPEYGYVLRGANCVMPDSESIPYVERSIDHFKSHSAPLQEAHSRIELSVALAYAGNFAAAMEELLRSEEILADAIAERHTILSNKASLLLLNEGNATHALDLLQNAAVTTRAAFDRLAIHNNTLIALSVLGMQDEAQELIHVIESICNSDAPADREIRKIAYRNISLFYESIGNSDRAKTEEDKVAAIHRQLTDEGKTDSILALEKDDGSWPTINGQRYYPCFLAHWHMEIGGSYDKS